MSVTCAPDSFRICVLPFSIVCDGDRITAVGVEVGRDAPLVIAGERNRQAGVAAEIDQRGREAFADDRHGAGRAAPGGHPFEAAGQHVDLIRHLEFEVRHLALGAGQLAADALADHAADRLAQIRRALVLDVGGLEDVGLDAALLDQLALDQRRDERRHPALADVDVDRDELGIAQDDVREELVEQEGLRPLQVGDHLNERVGVIDERITGHVRRLHLRDALPSRQCRTPLPKGRMRLARQAKF